MANIQERRDKAGKIISFSIRVHRGRGADGKQLKPWTATFDVKPTWNETTARKKAAAFAATFEKECKSGLASDCRQTFSAYCDYVIGHKEQHGVKHRTICAYRELTKRVYPAIGHLKIKDIRPDHLNHFYDELLKTPKDTAKARAKIDLPALLRERKLTMAALSRATGISINSVTTAVKGGNVEIATAQKITAELGLKFDDTFAVPDTGTLSHKTVREYARFCSVVLEQAVKEGLIPFNPAARADAPKLERRDPNYFEAEQIGAILEALKQEQPMWNALVSTLIYSGARRGEVLGIQWQDVDFAAGTVHICRNVQYSSERGLYVDTPKTSESDRTIKLPAAAINTLRWWKAVQAAQIASFEGCYEDLGFAFAQRSGQPMHPSTVGSWLKRFSARHDLPHINAHAFRHSMATSLYFNGADAVSISKRLGHSQVSTTSNFYAHAVKKADEAAANILEAAYQFA